MKTQHTPTPWHVDKGMQFQIVGPKGKRKRKKNYRPSGGSVMSLSWKPIRNGKIYCAPACGGGCTYDGYLKAIANGKAVLAKLKKRKGWSVHVNENLGWFTSLEKEGLKLIWFDHSGVRRFSLLWTGTPYNQKWFKDPNQAIYHWMDFVQKYIKQCLDILAEFDV